MSTVGSKNYNGQDWFWPHDYRHYLRDANPRQRKLVHNGWLKIGVPVKKSGLKISDRYLEPKKSQEKKAWTIVKKVIAPKELESVNEELNSSAYSQLSRSIKAIAINIKDLAKAHKKQDDGVVRNEIDNLLYDVKRMVNIISNKKYNESVNERSNPSDKKELLRALKNSKVADAFSLNNDELVIEMTSPSGTNFVVGNIRKYKGD